MSEDIPIVNVIAARPHGVFDTVIVFEGEEWETGRPVVFGVDHRPAKDILEALAVGEEVLAEVPDWSILEMAS